MGNSEEDKEILERKLKHYLLKKKDIEKQIKKIEKEIFKYETVFLETTQGFPLTKSLDYYLNFRVDKKKTGIKDSDRIFSKNIPKVNE
jgi:hypothetical protein